jgi:hypothetical protein
VNIAACNLFLCARCRCQVGICRACDHGQHYFNRRMLVGGADQVPPRKWMCARPYWPAQGGFRT